MPASRFKTYRQISENVWQTKKLTQKQKAIILKLRKKKQIKNNTSPSPTLTPIAHYAPTTWPHLLSTFEKTDA